MRAVKVYPPQAPEGWAEACREYDEWLGEYFNVKRTRGTFTPVKRGRYYRIEWHLVPRKKPRLRAPLDLCGMRMNGKMRKKGMEKVERGVCYEDSCYRPIVPGKSRCGQCIERKRVNDRKRRERKRAAQGRDGRGMGAMGEAHGTAGVRAVGEGTVAAA